MARNNFAAFDATTGALLPCNPSFTHTTAPSRVFALSASPAGDRLYVGGAFNRVTWSREPGDAWVGEVFLAAVGSLTALAVWGSVLAFSVAAFVAALTGDLPSYTVAVWLVAILGFPFVAFWTCRLIHRRTSPPVERRLYVIGVSGGLAAWAMVIVAVMALFLVATVLLGNSVPV